MKERIGRKIAAAAAVATLALTGCANERPSIASTPKPTPSKIVLENGNMRMACITTSRDFHPLTTTPKYNLDINVYECNVDNTDIPSKFVVIYESSPGIDGVPIDGFMAPPPNGENDTFEKEATIFTDSTGECLIVDFTVDGYKIKQAEALPCPSPTPTSQTA